MGLDMYWHGEKELSPKSFKERKILAMLNHMPFTQSQWEELTSENDYLYISDWTNKPLYDLFQQYKLTGQIGDVKGLKCAKDKKGVKHWTVITEAFYLRKANAIHKWMVANVQDDVDDCDYYPMDNTHIDKFIADVDAILADDSKKEELIPTQSGFFFGGTEYDEWYYHELKATKKRFKRFKAKCNSAWKFTYHSSW